MQINETFFHLHIGFDGYFARKLNQTSKFGAWVKQNIFLSIFFHDVYLKLTACI